MLKITRVSLFGCSLCSWLHSRLKVKKTVDVVCVKRVLVEIMFGLCDLDSLGQLAKDPRLKGFRIIVIILQIQCFIL